MPDALNEMRGALAVELPDQPEDDEQRSTSDHPRHRRLTNDMTAFVKYGRREKLQALCSTKIMTVDEFVAWIESDNAIGLLPRPGSSAPK